MQEDREQPRPGLGAPLNKTRLGAWRRNVKLGLALAALAIGGQAFAANADLLVSTQTVSPDPVLAGGQATFTLRVENNGPDAASNVVLTDTCRRARTLSA